MLAELMIANAAFKVIKTTISNGKEIADAGAALTKYFGASQSIKQKAALGTGDVLEWMLNKQGLLGYYKYCQFRDEFFKKQKALAVKQKVRDKEIQKNVEIGFIVITLSVIILAIFIGVIIYIKETM